MAFTDEDRAMLVRTATKVENIENRLEHLPCEIDPLIYGTQEVRLKSLETTRSRTITSVVSTIIAVLVAAIGYLFHRLGG
jgi:hypothetical protein